MKYLVTGGTGFIGRAIAENLLLEGHAVVVFDNNYRGDSSLLNESMKIEIVDGDIRDRNAVIKAACGIDSIIHLAFINGTKHFYEKPGLVVDVGIRGMMNVADAAKENKVEEIILVSTSETYQTPEVIPTPENVPLVVPDILNPRYSYGGAKIASELILVNFCSEFLKNWRIIRPHNIYGPNMGIDHVIPALITKSLSSENYLEIQGDGMQMRSFCFIDDFISAFRLIMNDSNLNQIYHIGTSEEVTVNELARLILKLIPKSLEIKHIPENRGETKRRCPDISKITNIGFSQKIPLQEGLEKTLQHYRSSI